MSLNCPNCGAGAGEDDARCDYCGSRLAAVACPSCLGSMFIGAQFCPHCGTKAMVIVVEDGESLPCPGCDGAMLEVKVGSVAMRQCADCGSAWLSHPAFQELCENREQRGEIAAALGERRSRPGTIAEPMKMRYVKCPVCRVMMNRVNFGRRSGVIVDVCRKDGVWFERDELRAVLAFVASGGLESLRAAEGDGADLRLRALLLADDPFFNSYFK